MKQTSLKSIARHMAAVQSGKVDKTNIIGIRKAINAMEQSQDFSGELIDAIFELEQAIREHPPRVIGALHESGLKVLRNPRYAKWWTPEQQEIIGNACEFRLLRFDRVGRRGQYGMPVYSVSNGFHTFAFRNIPWQTAYSSGLEDGPRVVPEREGIVQQPSRMHRQGIPDRTTVVVIDPLADIINSTGETKFPDGGE